MLFYESQIEIRKQLPIDNSYYQDGLASAYNGLAYLLKDHFKDYQMAKENYYKAIEIWEQLPKDNPEYQNGLASAYLNLAVLQADKLKDYISAKESYNKAIEIGEEKIPNTKTVWLRHTLTSLFYKQKNQTSVYQQ